MPPSTIAATWHALAVCVVAAAVVPAVGASPAVRHPFEELLRAGGASPVTRDAGSASTHAHAPSANSAFSDAVADGRDRRAAAGTCVDYTVDGYWANNNNPSVIPARMVARPASISVCELEQLHKDCVDRLNLYRSGALKFSDGTQDSNVQSGLTPLKLLTGSNECSSEQALGDLVINYKQGGGCAGAHANAFNCPWGSSVGQNSCCGRGGGSWGNQRYDTYQSVKEELFDCLQQMWDEGITPGQKGHWETMRSKTFNEAHCGFAWSTDGRVFLTQDFTVNIRNWEPNFPTCSCTGKSVGQSDGCGGTCVSSSGSVGSTAATTTTTTTTKSTPGVPANTTTTTRSFDSPATPPPTGPRRCSKHNVCAGAGPAAEYCSKTGFCTACRSCSNNDAVKNKCPDQCEGFIAATDAPTDGPTLVPTPTNAPDGDVSCKEHQNCDDGSFCSKAGDSGKVCQPCYLCSKALSSNGKCPGKCKGAIPPADNDTTNPTDEPSPTPAPSNSCKKHQDCAKGLFCNTSKLCRACSTCKKQNSFNGKCPKKC